MCGVRYLQITSGSLSKRSGSQGCPFFDSSDAEILGSAVTTALVVRNSDFSFAREKDELNPRASSPMLLPRGARTGTLENMQAERKARTVATSHPGPSRHPNGLKSAS